MPAHQKKRPTAQRVAIYARVSTTKQDNDNQLHELRDFARRQGWAVAAEYVDTITGSGQRSREQFDRAMQAASQRRYDVLLFWKLDRFSREGVRRTLRHLEQLDQWGVRWRSYTEPFFDSCGMMRDVVISIMATLAEQERITISERTKAGMRRAVLQGKRCGRPRVVVDAGRVRAMRKRKLSFRAIALELGVSHTLVARILGSKAARPRQPDLDPATRATAPRIPGKNMVQNAVTKTKRQGRAA